MKDRTPAEAELYALSDLLKAEAEKVRASARASERRRWVRASTRRRILDARYGRSPS